MKLEELKKIADARSPGKWTAKHTVIEREDEAWIMSIRSLKEDINEKSPFNIAFCAMASNHIDALIRLVEVSETVLMFSQPAKGCEDDYDDAKEMYLSAVKKLEDI